MRNWLDTLWDCSFKGVPYQVENDEESGGRRIVSHQFPNRDDPFHEDLGEELRKFEQTAYVASDNADGEAAALTAICATKGPGALVLSLHGPIIVRCTSFKRTRDKDKHGKVAFTLSFVREGAATALISVLSLANLVFAAADDVQAAIGAAMAIALRVVDVADHVRAAAVDGYQGGIAALEAIRVEAPVDPAASATQRPIIQAMFDGASDQLAADAQAVTDGDVVADFAGAQLCDVARALGDAIAPASSARAFAELVDATPSDAQPTSGTANAMAAADNANTVLRATRLAALTAWAEAISRLTYPDRSSGITARADLDERFANELDAMAGSGDNDLYKALTALRDATIAFLSRKITDLAPVLTVEANFSMPSLFWAWRLYQDPNRADEIVARNNVTHPSFMPASFEALAR